MKTHAPLLGLGILLILILGLFGIVRVMAGPELNQVACTADAKLCPDGSSVGRTGPNCEFAACPTPTGSDDSIDIPTIPNGYECNGDAKICPDGSTVGRTGSTCEFAACPSPNATSATIRTTIGQKMSGLNVSITPIEVTQDSRCPAGVQCIWAGTVKIKARIESALGVDDDAEMELGAPITTEAEEITLIEVTPGKSEGETIPASSYRFVFEVKKR